MNGLLFVRTGTIALVFALLAAGLSACGGGGDAVVVEVPAALEFALQPEETVVSNLFDTTVVFKDASGAIMPVNDLPVTLTLENNTGGAQLLGTVQASSEIGVCYFLRSLSIDTVGEGYTLRADWGNLTVVSEPFNIIPVQVGSIVFVKKPATTAVNAPFEVSIQVRDQTGNLLPRNDVDVTVALKDNPGGGTLSGTLTRTSVNGLCTFPGLSIDEIAMGYTMSAVHESFVAFSPPFDIDPPPVASIAFTTQPVDSDADATFDVVVELRDAGGNVTPRTGLQMTLSIANNPSSGTLSGTPTTTSVDGICTFTGLSIDKPGKGYTLRAVHQSFETFSDSFDILLVPPSWDSTFGTALSGSATLDDSGELVSFSGYTVPFYGVTYTGVYVNSNGNLTFGGSDSSWTPSSSAMASGKPRIAPWWDDLSPNVSGSIHFKQFSDRAVITYNAVPEFGGSGAKTCQVTLWNTGRIDIYYLSMIGGANSGLVGISPGNSLRSAQSFNLSGTVFTNWTSVGTNFPYENWTSGGPDLAPNGWVMFDPLGPSYDGSDGYRFTTSG